MSRYDLAFMEAKRQYITDPDDTKRLILIDLTAAVMMFTLGSFIEYTSRIDYVVFASTIFTAFSYATQGLSAPEDKYYDWSGFDFIPYELVFAVSMTVFVI